MTFIKTLKTSLKQMEEETLSQKQTNRAKLKSQTSIPDNYILCCQLGSTENLYSASVPELWCWPGMCLQIIKFTFDLLDIK